MQIRNNTFLVTGAASGLGFATAELLIEHGGNVIMLDIDETQGNSAAIKLGSAAKFIKSDVANDDQIKCAIDAAISQFGKINGLINCAGIAPAKRVVGKNGVHALDFFEKVISINLVGTFNTVRLAAEKMQENELNENLERGIIINTASIAAFDGQIGQAAYAASKGGVVAMTLPIARELASFGIRVMAIAPGIFETPMLTSMSQEVQESLGKQVPFPSRLGKPSEYAQLVKSIIENPMLNGEVIRLDGAIRMGMK